MKIKFSLVVLFVSILFLNGKIQAQCVNLIHYPADTVGWVHGSSETSGVAYYDHDTFVLTTPTTSENNFIYNSFPVTLAGSTSDFTASFDFRIENDTICCDGLTFWFFTSSLYQMGYFWHEWDMGFPDTTCGFALSLQSGPTSSVFMKHINSTGYLWSGSLGPDTANICPPLSGQTFLTDGLWHHAIVSYNHGYITTTFDWGIVSMSGYCPLFGTGHFGFMATNQNDPIKKSIKNIQICTNLGTPTVVADSFGSFINRLCNGPQIAVETNTYSSTYSVHTYYGDGTHDSTGFSISLSGGYAMLSHIYPTPGHYTIKEFLYNGSSQIDSLEFDYENIFCATLPVKFYFDANTDCLMDSAETYLAQVVKTEVDSNGIPVDTISATSGFYYNALGTVGDVYSFRSCQEITC